MPLGGERTGRLGEDPCDHRLRGVAGKRWLAAQHLVQHRAEGVDVGAGRDLPLAHRLLRAHVVRRAERHAGLGHPRTARLAGRERDAEVRDQRPPIVQEDVLRLDVAVDDAVAVRIVERRGDLARDADRVVDGELLLAVEPVAQRLALDEGHDVEEVRVHRSRVEERQDVRVLEVRGELDLGEEPLGADHGGELGPQDLERDPPVVSEVCREIDHGHAAGADLAVEPVAVFESGLETADELGDTLLLSSPLLVDGGIRPEGTAGGGFRNAGEPEPGNGPA